MSNPHLDTHPKFNLETPQVEDGPSKYEFSENYAYVVIKVLNDNAMSPLQGQVADCSGLQGAQTGAQGNLNNISQIFTALEGMATGNRATNIDTTSVINFIKEIKAIFYSDNQNPTYANLPTVYYTTRDVKTGELTKVALTTGPNSQMSAYWSYVQNEMSSREPGVFSNYNPIQTDFNSTSGVSDLQLYMLWKLQNNLDAIPNTRMIVPNNATPVTEAMLQNTYDPLPAGGAADSVVDAILGLADSMNTNTGTDPTSPFLNDTLTADPTNTANVAVVQHDLNNNGDNYYDHTHPASGQPPAHLDTLTPMTTATSTAQSVTGAQSQQLTSEVQQDTSEITSYDNTGQNIVQNESGESANSVKNIQTQ